MIRVGGNVMEMIKTIVCKTVWCRKQYSSVPLGGCKNCKGYDFEEFDYVQYEGVKDEE